MNDFELTKKAKEYAFEKHDKPSDCQRYGSEPYSKHLQDVIDNIKRYLYLLEPEDHEDVICSAWLHDSVEDTDVTPNRLKRMFNDRIARIVFNVSNERGWSKKEELFKTLPKIWECRLSTYVKMCDRLANSKNSKNGSSDKSKRMFIRYTDEYPIFRFALKEVDKRFDVMWDELDDIFNWK